MLNITSQKVILPTILFTLLSPGVILQLPDTTKLLTQQTSRSSTLFHAVVFAILYRFIASYRGIVLQPADLLVPTVLFVLLSPGILLSLPKKGLFLGSTSSTSVIIHALVFMLIFAFLRKQFPQYY